MPTLWGDMNAAGLSLGAQTDGATGGVAAAGIATGGVAAEAVRFLYSASLADS